MQICGYYYNSEHRPREAYRLFNTWMGDPLRLLQCKTILEVVKEEGLVEHARDTGGIVQNGLEELEVSELCLKIFTLLPH